MFHRDKRTVDTSWNFSFERLKLQESVMDNSLSCCGSKQLISKAYDTTGRNKELDDHTLSLRLHAEHFTLAEGNKIHCLSTDILR